MNDPAFLDDPVELRIRLDLALECNAVLEAENTRLKAEIEELRARAGATRRAQATATALPPTAVPGEHEAGGHLPHADHASLPQVKVALFRTLFCGREDVYARRWTSAKSGKSGWSPAEEYGGRDRPAAERKFFPLTDEVLVRHLGRTQPGERELHAGLYPMLPDDTCMLLVCDFDDAEWREDARAYHAAATAAGIDAALEVSRSGQGVHVWIFFTAPVAAHIARRLGFALLRDAIAARGTMKLSSYDRFFPSQDLLPDKANSDARLGNLIALPLNGDARANGTTVFCDPDTLAPYSDQFAYLSRITRLTPVQVEKLAANLGEVTAGPDNAAAPAGTAMPAKPRRTQLGRAPEKVTARMAAKLEIPTRGLPSALIAALKHAAALRNPEFYRRQAQRYSTYGTPRFVCCFDESDPERLLLPRGVAEVAADLFAAAGATLEITSTAPTPPPLKVRFTGTLTPLQQRAVEEMEPFDHGVLVAPTGKGKTAMACALIARHATPTAVLLPTQDLMEQWRDALTKFLDLPAEHIGALGAGRRRRAGHIDLIMIPTLARRAESEDLLDGYGLVVVDECQKLGGATTYNAVGRVNVRKWLGLSATPYRADQLDDLITFACGPIRHTIEPAPTIPQHLVTHSTDFVSLQTGKSISYPELYNELAADPQRNKQIAADTTAAVRRGRRTLVLSNRIEQLTALAEALKAEGVEPHLMHGAMPREERSAVRRHLSAGIDAPYVLLAIDKIATEGLDLPDLDTLVIASPVAFKGKVIQQIGRIQRAHSNKHDIEVHDYLDTEVPALVRMHAKRRKTLISQDFHPATADNLTDTAHTAQPPAQKPRSSTSRATKQSTTPATTPGPSPTELRNWARANGHHVADRGRISAEIHKAYAAHQAM